MEDKSVQRVALIIAAMSSFLTPFMASATNIALPKIAAELNMNAVSMGWVATAYLLSSAVFLVPMGRLADIVGRKKIFGFGSLLYLLASLMCAFSYSTAMLLTARVLQGLASAMVFGTGMAIVSSVFPPKDRGKAFGINTATVYLGLSMGPVLGGLLTEHLGWRSIFLFHVPLGIAIVVMLFWKLKGEWKEPHGRFDYIGSFVYGFSLILLMYGLSRLPGINGFGMIAAALALLVFFFMYEAKLEHPVLNTKLLKENKVFTYSNIAALINYCATFAIVFLLSLYLQYIKKMSPREAGMILIAQPVVMAIVSPFAGRLSDRMDPGKISSIGMAISAVGLFMFTFFNEHTSTLAIIANLVMLGMGFGLFSSPNTTAVMASVEKQHYGVASSMLGTMRLIGQMLSLAIATLVISLIIGEAKITPGNYLQFPQCMKISFIVFAVLSIFGIFASLARNRQKDVV